MKNRESVVKTPVAWAAFAVAAPVLAAFGHARLERRVAYLATVRADGAPRVHPVSPFIADGGLWLYMEPGSPKAADLRRDARYALHCGVEDDTGDDGEFYVTGRASEVTDAVRRRAAFAVARAAGYRPADRHVTFELAIGRVLATTYDDGPRDGPRDGPSDGPRRERWPSSR
jgi:hypothetical protein